MHVSARLAVDELQAHYDRLFRVISTRLMTEPSPLWVERKLQFHATPGRAIDVSRVRAHLALMADVAAFEPQCLVVDGLQGGHDTAEMVAALAELVSTPPRPPLRAWVAIETTAPLPAPLFQAASLVVSLVPTHNGDRPPRLRLRRVHEADDVHEDLPAILEPNTLLAVEASLFEGQATAGLAAGDRIRPGDCTLFSGGATGAETAFGEVASRYGVREVAFTFEGHLQDRTVGRQPLTPQELAMGDVSLAYVSKRLNRSYNDRGGLIRGVLQTLWHMVSRSHQVFVIGAILEDGTVKGGTGWGVELARMWSRDLWVYDVPEGRWCRWDGDTSSWVPGNPTIRAAQFCGTGTRKLAQAGRAAIEALFRDSFGPPPS